MNQFSQDELTAEIASINEASSQPFSWYQKTLKQSGILTKVEEDSTQWIATKNRKSELDKIKPSCSVAGYSTHLGLAIIGYSEQVLKTFDEPIHLIITSPPYPLTNPRKYGNVNEKDYVNWICETIEPAVRCLVDGGSLCLNISNDIFLSGSPARSLYRERLVLALHDQLGLFKMDELIWENRSKPPGPYQWASKKRVQLNVGWEPVYWFTNNPDKVLSNNQQVLQPHSEAHLKFMQAGGSQVVSNKSDGAYRIKKGSYGRLTPGKIPKNVLSYGTACSHNRHYKRTAEALGYQVHGAMMPFKLAAFLIEFLSDKMHLVVDPFAGSQTVAEVCESLQRRWVTVDPLIDYVIGGGQARMANANGFHLHGI